jgi:tetratricopeptide (TPR) repeat protein
MQKILQWILIKVIMGLIRVEGLIPRSAAFKKGIKPEYNHQSRTNIHRCSAAVLLINPRIFLFLVSCFSFLSVLPAQDFGRVGSLAAEIQRLDAVIQDIKADEAAKKSALNEKAQLLEMTGNIEEAARIWNEAAFVTSNNRDDEALLRSAVCFAAMGEYSQSDAALKTILLTGKNTETLKAARYLAAQIEVLRNGEKGFPVLLSFLNDAEYSSSKPGIYYLLWKVSGNESYKSTLIADFSESPEAQLARDDNSAVTQTITPMWLLFPGREQLLFSAPITEAPAAANTTVRTDGKNGENPSDESEMPVLIQVGLYSKKENAQAMIDRLKAKGFAGTISEKNVSGITYWQVTLPSGADANKTIMTLKDAGFESFPVF